MGTAKQREVWKATHLGANRPASSWLCKLQGVCAFNPCLLGVDGGASSAGSTMTESEGKVLVAQSCLTLCDPMDCSLPGSSVHGILQARILEWVAIFFSRVIFQSQELNLDLLHCRQILYYLSHKKLLRGNKIF